MITLPIICRIIGPEKYGAVNYAFAFVGYFILFINAGFDLYGSRKIVSFREDKQKIQELFSTITFAKFYILAAVTVLFTACLFLVEPVREEKLVNIFTYLLCIGWVVNPSWLYNGMQDSRRYAVFSFFSKLIFTIAIIIVVRERSDYIYHPLITSLAHILVSGISFYYALKKYGLRFNLVPVRRVFAALKENRSLSLIWWITNQASSTGIIVAGFLLTTVDLGIYSAALRIVIILQTIISMPLNMVLFPYIGEAFVQGYQEGMKRVNKAFPYLFFLSIGMAVGVFIMAKPIILLFFGQEFAGSVYLLKLLAVALFFATINAALGQQVMLNLKRDSVYLKFLFAGFVLNILLFVILIQAYGVTGAAIAWPVAEVLLFAGYMIYFKRQDIRVVDYAFYRPGFIIGNTLKLIRLNPLKNKTALR